MPSPNPQPVEQDIHRPLKVAVLVRMFPNIVQTYVLNHIISLIRSGTSVLIVAEKDPEQAEIHPDIGTYGLHNKTMYINTAGTKLIWSLLMMPVAQPRFLKAFLRILFSKLWSSRGIKYSLQSLIRARVLVLRDLDIAHSHSLFNSYQYLFLKEIFSIPLVTTFHGLIPNSAKMLAADKVSAVLDTCDIFYVNTRFACDELSSLGCPEQKIQIIPQGTNIEDFPFINRRITSKSPVTILSVGRLSFEKGFHVAIRAIAILKDIHPNIDYRIIGSGHEMDALKNLISSLHLDNNVCLFGFASTRELCDHYREANIFVLPSINLRDGTHTETQGVVLQEAQSSGIPVVASRTGGIPEVIHDGETGLLFDEEDHVGLAAILDRLISETSLYQSLAKRARRDVEENFSTEAINKRMIASYHRILSQKSNATVSP